MLRASAYSPTYNDALGTTQPYRGTDQTVAKMIELMLGDRGERSIKVRRHTEQIVQNIRPKDYASEFIAICRWWGNAARYTRDPLHVEMLRDPERLVDDAMIGKLSCDCDEYATAIGTGCMTLGGRVQLLTVGFRARTRMEPAVYTHVFCRAQDPRTKIWWVLDPVAGRKTGPMVSKVQQIKTFEVE